MTGVDEPSKLRTNDFRLGRNPGAGIRVDRVPSGSLVVIETVTYVICQCLYLKKS